MADDTTAPACSGDPGDIASTAGAIARYALRMLLAATLLGAAACGPPSPRGPSELAAAGAPLTASPLDAWLSQHPAVAGAIVWESEQGAIPWTSWDAARRRALAEAFEAEAATLQGRGDARGFPLNDPPPNLGANNPRQVMVLGAADAWRLYVAHVGHSLALEIHRIVPWSLASDSPESLQALLDGRSMFTWRPEHGGYLVDPQRSGWVVPAPPAMELGFLMRERLLGPTRLATIEAMIGWSRRLHHVRGRLSLDNAEQVWQYRGLAPVSRVLAPPGPQGGHVTAGCWGTTGLLIAVLRAANIPVRLAHVRVAGRGPACSHAQPFFVSEGRFLSHGDDPYNQIVVSLGDTLPPGRLLVDQATWAGWFGEGVDPDSRCRNIGRQVLELALETLPPHVINAYCEDERSGKDRRMGRIARMFTSDRPVTAFPHERLVQARLWERLAEKVRASGGCAAARVAPPAPDPFEPTGEP